MAVCQKPATATSKFFPNPHTNKPRFKLESTAFKIKPFFKKKVVGRRVSTIRKRISVKGGVFLNWENLDLACTSVYTDQSEH